MRGKKVILIVPAYNEEKSILKTINEINKYNNKAQLKLDYVVINDGSKDNTKKVLEKNNINHIDLEQNLGIGGAVQTGYKYAQDNHYDYAIQYDGDGQHDINYAQDLIDPLIKGEADMCIGSRFVDNAGGFKSTVARRIGIKIISLLIWICTKKRVLDTTSGYRAVNKKIIKLFAEEYPKQYPEPGSTTMVIKLGYNVKEIPVNMQKRKYGKSSIGGLKKIYYMVNVSYSIIRASIRK